VRPGGLGNLKKIYSPARDLSACSIVPQPIRCRVPRFLQLLCSNLERIPGYFCQSSSYCKIRCRASSHVICFLIASELVQSCFPVLGTLTLTLLGLLHYRILYCLGTLILFRDLPEHLFSFPLIFCHLFLYRVKTYSVKFLFLVTSVFNYNYIICRTHSALKISAFPLWLYIGGMRAGVPVFESR
jgi:hypothetical protein